MIVSSNSPWSDLGSRRRGPLCWSTPEATTTETKGPTGATATETATGFHGFTEEDVQQATENQTRQQKLRTRHVSPPPKTGATVEETDEQTEELANTESEETQTAAETDIAAAQEQDASDNERQVDQLIRTLESLGGDEEESEEEEEDEDELREDNWQDDLFPEQEYVNQNEETDEEETDSEEEEESQDRRKKVTFQQ